MHLMLVLLLSFENFGWAQTNETKVSADSAKTSETVTVTAKKLLTEPGSSTVLSKEQLELYKYTDLNRALKSVPGVQIQEEDGFGLRPNIGMRGAHPHRSRKILIMEDGIPSGPAPYAAPAAYFVPDMSFVEGIEVTKGPAAIRYGPQTIGGSINLLSKAIPSEPFQFSLDAAAGSFGFTKAIGALSGSTQDFSWMLQSADLGARGFKTLPDGGGTGFHKRIERAKFRLRLTEFQALQLKIDWADEYSPETYLGLSREDFDLNPYQRYAASAEDHMQNVHRGFLLEHLWQNGLSSQRLAIYHNNFERDWTRLDGFTDRTLSLRKILGNPVGQNQHEYAVLKGFDDSLGDSDHLLIAHNLRKFYSQGIALEGRTTWNLDTEHSNELQWGLRAHRDGIHRMHRNEVLRMENGQLAPSELPSVAATQNKYEAESLAAFVWNSYRLKQWIWSLGLRQEWIRAQLDDLSAVDADSTSTRSALMPSLGVFYQMTPELGWLFGVYRGMGLALADDEGASSPEESLNYESGIRWAHSSAQIDAISFWNHYKNIKGTCSASESCSGLDSDLTVNGGQAQIYGLELIASYGETWLEVYWPLAIQYTWTRAYFDNEFESILEDWGIGTIRKGDPLQYIQQNQLNIQAVVSCYTLHFQAQWKYLTKSFDQSLREDRLELPASCVLDLSTRFFADWGQEFYANIENVTSAKNTVSYRPFGARPGKPRTYILGTKLSF